MGGMCGVRSGGGLGRYILAGGWRWKLSQLDHMRLTDLALFT